MSETESVVIEIPVKILSTANMNEHWAAKRRRNAKICEAVVACISAKMFPQERKPPARITFTRLSQKHRILDHDNCVAALKPVRDSIARLFGCDDKEGKGLTFEYAPQEVADGYGLRVTIESSDGRME